MKLRRAIATFCALVVGVGVFQVTQAQSSDETWQFSRQRLGLVRDFHTGHLVEKWVADLKRTNLQDDSSAEYSLVIRFAPISETRDRLPSRIFFNARIRECPDGSSIRNARWVELNHTSVAIAGNAPGWMPDGSGVIIQSMSLNGLDLIVGLSVNGMSHTLLYGDALTTVRHSTCRTRGPDEEIDQPLDVPPDDIDNDI